MLTDIIRIERVSNAVAAGATDSNGTGVDLTGADGVVFVAQFGTLTANQVTGLKAQQSDDDGSTDDYSDLAGSLAGPMGDDDDNDMLALDVLRPEKKFVRPVVTRATANAVIDSVLAIVYRLRTEPVTQDARVIDLHQLVRPAEGTA